MAYIKEYPPESVCKGRPRFLYILSVSLEVFPASFRAISNMTSMIGQNHLHAS